MAARRMNRSLSLHLLLGALSCALFGTIRNASEIPPRQVTGIRGGSVLFPVETPPTTVVLEMEWTFRAGNGPIILIAEFVNGQLQRPDPSDRFAERLEMPMETTLRVTGLEMEDTGVYKARVRLAAGEVQDHAFSLAVYDPLPKPQIFTKMVSRAPSGCNVTLQCQVHGKGRFNVSWERGDPPRRLDGGSDGYQLSENGTDLHVFWAFDPSNSTFACLVSNAVDQKSSSVDLLSVCPSEGASLLRRRNIVVGAVAVVLVLLAVVAFWLWKNKRKSPAG